MRDKIITSIVFLSLLILFFLSCESFINKNNKRNEANYRIDFYTGIDSESFYTEQTPTKEENCIKFDNTEICGTYTIIKLK